jgi:radical SAM-linked protein
LKTRFAYTKKNRAAFIAHLDLTRVFDRALRRAQIAVHYSEGFNPHPKISFGPPLPVGVQGEREFVDLEIKKPENFPPEEFLGEVLKRLQNQLPPGIQLLKAGLRTEKTRALMSEISLLRYRVRIPRFLNSNFREIEEACKKWMAKSEALVVRFRKGKSREKNIRPFVKKIEVLYREESEELVLRFEIRIGREGSTRPEEILENICLSEGLVLDLEGMETVREGLYIETKSGKLLDPLHRKIIGVSYETGYNYHGKQTAEGCGFRKG